jgi:hypothetical protein
MRHKKTALFIGLALALLVALWLFERNKSPTAFEGASETVAQSNVTVQAAPNARVAAQQDATTNGSRTTNAAAPQHASLPELSNAMQRRIDQIQRPIIFYGKVVDEKGQALAGANAHLMWSQFYPEGTFETNLLADVSGSFAFQGAKGARLFVSVAKAGYYDVKSLNLTSFQYSELEGAETFRPDISNPVIFHLRKKGQGANLLTSQRGMSPVMEFSIPGDGSPVRVDFFNRVTGNQGQMDLAAIKPPKTNERGPKAWSFRMSIPDGGFVEENDEFPIQAPTTGYMPNIEFNFTPGDTNWTDTIAKHYYVEFGQPPRFGRIDITTGLYRGVQLGYAINPTGSTDLEAAQEPPQPQRALPPGAVEVVPPKTH